MSDLFKYKTELGDILQRLRTAKEEYAHLNSLKLDKHITLMEESVFRVEHQINKQPLVTNSLYVESNDNANRCMDCCFCTRKYCTFRKHGISRKYGSCPEFEEKEE